MAKHHWLLVSNPTKVWDVWGWWLAGNRNFDGWTVSKHWSDIAPGDDVALWISGKNAGVYAVGTAASGAEPYTPDPDDPFWIDPPDPSKTRYVRVNISRYLFDAPIFREDLKQNPAFAGAFILRMPNGGNPSPLTDAEWDVVRRTANKANRSENSTDVSVLESPIGDEVEEVLLEHLPGTSLRTYPEARLLKDYERWLGRALTRHTIGLPSGERLVTDAYDRKTGTLIEAKASASREAVRMALGQLLDYQRHLPTPPKRLAVLLPEKPAGDLLALLASEQVTVIAGVGRSFTELAPRRRGTPKRG